MFDINAKGILLGLLTGITQTVRPTDAPRLVPHPDGQRGLVAVAEGYELKTLDGPTHTVPTHTFEDVASLAAWLKRGGYEDADILVGGEKVRVILLGGGDAEEGSATLPLIAHPALSRWLDATKKVLTQRDLYKLLSGAASDTDRIVDQEGKFVEHLGTSIAKSVLKFSAIKTGTVEVEQDASGVTTLLSVSEKTTIKGTLPPHWNIHVPVYLGGPPTFRTLRVCLEVIPAKDGPPSFALEIPELSVALLEARRELAAHLQSLLGEGFLVGLGITATETRKSQARVGHPGAPFKAVAIDLDAMIQGAIRDFENRRKDAPPVPSEAPTTPPAPTEDTPAPTPEA